MSAKLKKTKTPKVVEPAPVPEPTPEPEQPETDKVLEVYAELSNAIKSAEECHIELQKLEASDKPEEELEAEVSEALFETYSELLDVQQLAKALCTAYRRKYNIREAEVKKYIRSNEQDE